MDVRREKVTKYIKNFDKEINELNGRKGVQKAIAGKKTYEEIDLHLDGINDLGPAIAAKVPKTRIDYVELLKKPLKAGAKKLNKTQLSEIVRCLDGSAVNPTITNPELFDIITANLTRLYP